MVSLEHVFASFAAEGALVKPTIWVNFSAWVGRAIALASSRGGPGSQDNIALDDRLQ